MIRLQMYLYKCLPRSLVTPSMDIKGILKRPSVHGPGRPAGPWTPPAPSPLAQKESSLEHTTPPTTADSETSPCILRIIKLHLSLYMSRGHVNISKDPDPNQLSYLECGDNRFVEQDKSILHRILYWKIGLTSNIVLSGAENASKIYF